jgi:hypothetical protein
MTDTEATKLGLDLIELLQLKLKNTGRVKTSWGDKTPAGLARSVLLMAECECKR